MINQRMTRGLLLGACLFAASVTSHAAGLFRAYLSASGNDANPCSVTAPCRLLPAALAAVADGGEIWMLDSANYNTATVNITKSVTILAVPGAVGSVVAIGGPAISSATSSIHIVLRNLVIVPFSDGTGTDGVDALAALTLTLEKTIVGGNINNGIVGIGATVRLVDSVIRDNQVDGVKIVGGRLYVLSSRILGNQEIGVEVNPNSIGTPTFVVVSDSVISNNGSGFAIVAFIDGVVGRASITRSTFADNVQLGAGAGDQSVHGADLVLSVGSSAFTGNAIGVQQFGAGAVFETQGNNMLRQNGTSVLGTPTLVGGV
jgi:hypothetical protein